MPQKFQHDRFGECELVRIEGVEWIVRSCDSGQLYRVIPSRRQDFAPIAASRLTASANAEPTLDSVDQQEYSSAQCREGVDQLLRAIRNGNRPSGLSLLNAVEPLVPVPSRLHHVEIQPERTVISSDDEHRPNVPRSSPLESELTTTPVRPIEVESLIAPHPAVTEPCVISVTDGAQTSEKRRLRRVFESLRNGLSPIHIDSRPFAVGIEVVQQQIDNLLADVATEGGRTIVLRGSYGQGKTFCLQLLSQLALESDYIVASTEVDSNENRLDKPHCIYRSLLQHLVFPDAGGNGVSGLTSRTVAALKRRLDPKLSGVHYANSALQLLEREIQCTPLAWLLSEPDLLQKENLVSLLACERQFIRMSEHVLWNGRADWPRFMYGTQGDVASYLLSGIGRLSRFLGYRGMIIILDEMEKWQNLDWRAQARAGNLLGGLIWASSAETGHRSCNKCGHNWRYFEDCDHTPQLVHSGVQGGFPFTTNERCSLGVAIAMTPRDDEPPETAWSDYGVLEIVDLPSFTPAHLTSYVKRVFPAYCRAYDLANELPSELPAAAMKSWRLQGDGSTRTAIQAVMSTLDGWQQSLNLQKV